MSWIVERPVLSRREHAHLRRIRQTRMAPVDFKFSRPLPVPARRVYSFRSILVFILFLGVASVSVLLVRSKLIFSISHSASADLDVPIESEENAHSFIRSAASYYRFPKLQASKLPESGILTEEVPVVLAIAKQARVKPPTVVALRQSGANWLSILRHYKIDSNFLFLRIKSPITNAPYAAAYSYFTSRPKKPARRRPPF